MWEASELLTPTSTEYYVLRRQLHAVKGIAEQCANLAAFISLIPINPSHGPIYGAIMWSSIGAPTVLRHDDSSGSSVIKAE